MEEFKWSLLLVCADDYDATTTDDFQLVLELQTVQISTNFRGFVDHYRNRRTFSWTSSFEKWSIVSCKIKIERRSNQWTKLPKVQSKTWQTPEDWYAYKLSWLIIYKSFSEHNNISTRFYNKSFVSSYYCWLIKVACRVFRSTTSPALEGWPLSYIQKWSF